MTTASIADIYDTIKNCDGEYCSICFRPASERRLVHPVFLIQLRSSLLKFLTLDASKNVNDTNKEIKVCYLCETMAARTLRFQEVVTLAASVEALLTWMTDDFRDALKQHQQYPKQLTREMNRMIIRTKELEAALKETVVPQLASSNVLHVGSDAIEVPTAGPSISTALTTPVTRPFNPSTNAKGTTGTTQHNNRDGSRCLGAPGLAQVTSAGHLQLQVKEQGNGKIVLHPIVIGTNEKMYVPSLKVEVVNNEILRSVSDMDLFKYANIPIPPAPGIRNNIVNNISNAGIFYDLIRQQTEHKEANKNAQDPLEILSTDDDTPNEKTVQATVNQNCVNNASLNTDSNCLLTRRIERRTRKRKRKVGVGVVGGVLKPVRTYAVKSATKRPVMQMDKVLDWEDKIPMDVISFMDATDPNPNERIMQPNIPISPPSPTMGFISNVRTINEIDDNGNVIDGNVINGNENNGNTVIYDEDVDNDVMLIENIECIDLC